MRICIFLGMWFATLNGDFAVAAMAACAMIFSLGYERKDSK